MTSPVSFTWEICGPSESVAFISSCRTSGRTSRWLKFSSPETRQRNRGRGSPTLRNDLPTRLMTLILSMQDHFDEPLISDERFPLSSGHSLQPIERSSLQHTGEPMTSVTSVWWFALVRIECQRFFAAVTISNEQNNVRRLAQNTDKRD